MPDSPTPAQLLRLRDIVVPPPKPLGKWADNYRRDQFANLSPRDAIAEFEAIVRAKGWRKSKIEGTDGNTHSVWHDDAGRSAYAKFPDELLADFLACIRAFIALGMVSEDQAVMIEKGEG